jgi:hypothetical protein
MSAGMLWIVAAGVVAFAVAATVLWQWVAHPAGVKDFTSGGIAYVVSDDREALAWVDWSIGLTRIVTVDRRAGRLRIARRAFLGLVPVGGLDEPLSNFYRVELRADAVEHYRRSSRRTFLNSTYGPDTYVERYDYRLELVDRHAGHVCVLSLSGGRFNDTAVEGFVTRLRSRLEDALASAGSTASG